MLLDGGQEGIWHVKIPTPTILKRPARQKSKILVVVAAAAAAAAVAIDVVLYILYIVTNSKCIA